MTAVVRVSDPRRVTVFGLGYVGTVTAAAMSRDGHRVIGVDVNADKVAEVASGRSPVSEPGVEELLRSGVESGRISAVRDADEAVRQSDVSVICVGSPSDARGEVDGTALLRVADGIGRTVREEGGRHLVVIRSTVLPHLLENEFLPRLEEALGEPLGERMRVAVNPEFLREATALADYDAPAIVVAGSDHDGAALETLDLFPQSGGARIATDLRTACLVKYAANAFHAAKIVFANEIGQLAADMGADGVEVMRAMTADTRLNASAAYLRPGFAFGGSCLPKDVRALVRYARKEAVATPLLESMLPSNEAMIDRGVEQVLRRCRSSEAGPRPRVGLAGLSFKAGTDDLRESPAVRVAERLIGAGVDLRIFDPGVSQERLRGRNRAYVDQRLPHLSALLVDGDALIAHAAVLVVTTAVADELPAFEGPLVDLRTDLVRARTQPGTAALEEGAVA